MNETQKILHRLHNQGWAWGQIARKCEVSRQTIWAWATAANEPPCTSVVNAFLENLLETDKITA